MRQSPQDVERTRTALLDAAELLFRARGADLLVAGAYSRARGTQLLFGGTTRSLLADAALPLLMSR